MCSSILNFTSVNLNVLMDLHKANKDANPLNSCLYVHIYSYIHTPRELAGVFPDKKKLQVWETPTLRN